MNIPYTIKSHVFQSTQVDIIDVSFLAVLVPVVKCCPPAAAGGTETVCMFLVVNADTAARRDSGNQTPVFVDRRR